MHFVYVVHFEPRLGEACISCDFIRILVLMDGSVPKPIMKPLCRERPNQSMKPTPQRNNLSVFAKTPCRGLSLSR
jgi:hypothetical protein